MKKEVPVPVVIAGIVAAIAFVGFLVYQGMAGGVQGDGKANNIEAAPHVPKAIQHQRGVP